ncbi:MAG: transcriptional regulator [Gammaproteobacteria bacterium]|jgi:hypothetical protein|nr:transcriptional regulator [Gammaproteobacteria bacterium]MBT4607763.1 transcriptional regulator [Thiotrichales bacterium]MBT4081938.1 transcriptional regulator [Gammaproteobacteria bacterium]MBT4330953.1 transcriptional regulator [Gammaproteobacteria bacterium]MBT4812592.1 transcriptional regulator [Thiotrichales bacterium]
MVKRKKRGAGYLKAIDERYPLSKKQGGGVIRVEVWEDSNGEVVKYSISYINYAICQKDNGRVIGYDNAHDYHHKHYLGEIFPVNDFESYEALVGRFEQEIKEYIQ